MARDFWETFKNWKQNTNSRVGTRGFGSLCSLTPHGGGFSSSALWMRIPSLSLGLILFSCPYLQWPHHSQNLQTLKRWWLQSLVRSLSLNCTVDTSTFPWSPRHICSSYFPFCPLLGSPPPPCTTFQGSGCSLSQGRASLPPSWLP